MKRYYEKRPNETFGITRDWGIKNWWKTAEIAQKKIEENNRPGYTREPWAQLVEYDTETKTHIVVAEFDIKAQSWCSWAQAEGLVNKP